MHILTGNQTLVSAAKVYCSLYPRLHYIYIHIYIYMYVYIWYLKLVLWSNVHSFDYSMSTYQHL